MLMRISGATSSITSVAPVQRPRALTIDAHEIHHGDPQRHSREPRIEAFTSDRLAVPRSAHRAIQAYRDVDAVALEPLLQDVFA